MTSLSDYILVKKASSASDTAFQADTTERKQNAPSADSKLSAVSLTRSVAAAPRAARSSLPPRIDATVVVRHRFRFNVTSASAVSVTNATLLGALGGICTVANTTVKGWVGSYRLRSVTVWPGALTTSQTSAQLQWGAGTSSQARDQSMIESIPEGVTSTSGLVFVPPPEALASMWVLSNASMTVFTAVCPVGSILDLSVEMTLSNVASGVSSTVAAGVLGTAYYLALDGPSGNLYKPIGVPTTA